MCIFIHTLVILHISKQCSPQKYRTNININIFCAVRVFQGDIVALFIVYFCYLVTPRARHIKIWCVWVSFFLFNECNDTIAFHLFTVLVVRNREGVIYAAMTTTFVNHLTDGVGWLSFWIWAVLLLSSFFFLVRSFVWSFGRMKCRWSCEPSTPKHSLTVAIE